MKDKLRELAARWKARPGRVFTENHMLNAGVVMGKCECATELLAILDAEGDDHSNCQFSIGICGSITAGKGQLDEYGYWEYPCTLCALRVNLQAAEDEIAELKAEGDGVAVAWQYRYKNDRMQWSRWLHWEIEDREDQFPEKIGRWEVEYRRLYTRPARSGVVSDEDVEAALKIWNDAPALGRDEDDAYAMRAALEHFAKGERHER